MSRPRFSARLAPWIAATLLPVLAGCESITGPSIQSTGPRITGRVVDAATDAPVAWARVGREPRRNRGPQGEFPKGAEDQLARAGYVRTDRDGRFDLPESKVALLFGFGDVMQSLRLVVEHSAYRRLDTNFPSASVTFDASAPTIDAGTLRLERR